MAKEKEVILTGLRANSEFHLGNYLGAILPMVELQKKHAGEYQLNMFIPDLHSFTTPIDHGQLYEQTHQNLKVFVAAGLDINQPDTFIYRQSYIPAHSELTWILSCFTYFGEMRRMTAFKDKSRQIAGEETQFAQAGGSFKGNEISDDRGWRVDARGGIVDEKLRQGEELIQKEGIENLPVTIGLFNYPVLMAADILLYGAKYVPVGDDQRQHVEFAREIANRLNNRFKDLFIMPADNSEQAKFLGREDPMRIRSLRNPERKMSKSVDDPTGTIMLTDTPEESAKKIMEATTDSEGAIKFDFEKQPGISNLLQILALVTGKPQAEVNAQFEGKSSYSELKQAVAETVKDLMTDLQTKLVAVDETKLMKKLEIDEAAMSQVASDTLLRIQKAVGLRPK